jgi:hypothetical protein
MVMPPCSSSAAPSATTVPFTVPPSAPLLATPKVPALTVIGPVNVVELSPLNTILPVPAFVTATVPLI